MGKSTEYYRTHPEARKKKAETDKKINARPEQKARTVKTGSRYAVIGEVCGVRQPVPAGKLL